MPGITKATPHAADFVRHAGWLFSLALAASATLARGLLAASDNSSPPEAYPHVGSVATLVLWLVAAEAVASDVCLWKKHTEELEAVKAQGEEKVSQLQQVLHHECL